ncbi:MAG: 30S ribosomal protein S17 [Candidatus Woesearchaeota archaeon]
MGSQQGTKNPSSTPLSSSSLVPSTLDGYRVHGRIFEGIVVSAKRHKTVKVAWEWKRFVPKYERYEKKRSVVHAHVPTGFHVEEGDHVVIQETRPISKTKHFIVIEKKVVQSFPGSSNSSPSTQESKELH